MSTEANVLVGAFVGALAAVVLVPLLFSAVTLFMRKRYAIGRKVRFTAAEDVARDGTITGEWWNGCVEVRDHSGTEYKVKTSRITRL